MKKLIYIFLLIGTQQLWSRDCPKPSSCEAFEYAEYAEKVYRDNSEGKPFELDCLPMSSDPLRLSSVKKLGDGLYAEVFKRGDGYVIAFRGSKEDQDWIDNFDQGLNGHNEQFAEAMKYFELVNTALNECGNKGPRAIVGHSLGGALAQHVATVAEQKPPNPPYTVVTFNPASLLPANSPKPNVCVFNYVHGDDILKRVVNPLLAELKRVDEDKSDFGVCKKNNVASGYSGTNIVVGVEVEPFDFTGTLTSADVAALRIAAKEFPEINAFFASGTLNIIFNSDRLDQIITRLSPIKGLEKVFTKIDSKLGADWGNLCSTAKDLTGGPFLLYDAYKFKSSLEKVFDSLKDAHVLGEVTNRTEIENWEKRKKDWVIANNIWEAGRKNNENMKKIGLPTIESPKPDPLPPSPDPEYDSDSLLGVLQEQCKGGRSRGPKPWHPPMAPRPDPNIPGGGGGEANPPPDNNTVSGGCFGDVPLVNGRVPTFLDGMGQIIDGIGDIKDKFEIIEEGIEAAREVEAIAKKLKAQFDAFDKFTAGVGKAAPVINKIFDVVDAISSICDVSTLVVDGYTALATGDNDAFADMINERVRDAVVDASKGIGSTLGEFLGMAIGATGGPMAPLTSWFGGWLGGEVGEWIGEKVGGWAYDKFIADWIKKNIADFLFDMLCPNQPVIPFDPGVPTDPVVPNDPNNPNNPPVPPPTGPDPEPPEILDLDSVKILPLSPGKILKSNPTQPYTREKKLQPYSK